MNITEYVKRLGIEPKSSTASPLDIEAGKAGYNQYLADVEAATTAKQEAKDNESFLEKIGRYLGNGGAQDTSLGLNQGFNQAVEAYKNMPADNKPKDDWTDEERWAFGEKYATNTEDAYAFAKELNSRKAKEQKQKQEEALAKWSGKNIGTGILGSAASLGINAVMGSAGYLDALAQRAAGREVEQNVILPHEISGAMQGGIANKLNEKGGTINEKVPIFGGKGWGDVYGLGMSIGQSALAGATGGSAGTLIQFFGMSASQGVSDALARGATGDQAIAFGTIAGAAEAITEMISIDKILGIASAEGVQNLFKNILKQAGEEAREEFTTAMITNVADNWIMGGKSQFYQTVNQLVASGMSVEEAKKKAWLQTIEDIAFDTLSGAASGGISGALGTGINRFNQRFLQTEANETAKKALTPEQDNLIAEAKKYDSTKKRASALEKKIADGKELTGYDLRMLANQVNEASRTADVDTARKAIVDRMKSEGLEDGQANRLGEIALNKAIGNEISKVQELMLKRNPAAMKVYNQMSEEMMQSGLGDSEWAKNTPIEKLRAQNKTSMSERDTEQRVQSGIERLKDEIASRYGVDTKEYKINMDSIEGKFGEIENKIVYKPGENSKIHVDGISSSLTQDDIVELSAVEKIANELGIDIHVYETKVDKKTGERVYTDKTGKRYSDSGFYDPNDNSIHIDLRAGENGEGTMLYTASHEVVHFIKENAAEHYAALEELVTKELIQGGFSIDTLIEEQRKILRQNGWSGEESDFEAVAREEMVAEACQSFLASKNAVAEIKALKTENKGLWNALKKFFTSLFTKISNVYKTVPPDSEQGKYIADMRRALKPIRDAFMEGAVEAAKKSASGNKTEVKTTEKKAVKSQARVTSEHDTAYLDAVKRGDMETAQRMVDEAADKALSDSKIRLPDGKLRTVYHGTNTGDFTVFNPDFIGMSSGDDGFFGMGFYFAYSKGEAKYYGSKRIISAYLDLKNPFDFETELQKYKGEKASGGNAPDAVALMNFADKFEDIAKDITISVVENGSDTVKEISLSEFSKAFKDVIENKKFEYSEITNEYGEKETLVTADPKTYEYEYNGKTHTYKDYSFEKRFWGKPNRLDVAYEYLASSVYRYVDMIRRTRLILDYNRQFTAALKSKGYDGAIQSQLGDEAVVFYPEQIKSADPVTYDDNGNIIPLSDRFNPENKDIRHKARSITTKDSHGNELTAEQQEYFKDSKVRDENGNLLVVYHGSASEFTVFNKSKIGAHGSAHGHGFYFTENEGLASSYHKEGGQLLKGYLNITNPVSEEKLTIKKNELLKLIKAICEQEARNLVADDEYSTVTEALRDTFISNYVNTYEMSLAEAYREVADIIYPTCDNDTDLLGELFNSGARGLALEKTREVLGYDGVIYTNSDGVHEYVAFTSNQFKNTTNKSPTKSADIRHKARKKVDLYSEKEYNNYGWARANDVLSAKENTKLRSLFADAVSKQSNPPRTKSGEYMIAIGEDVDNKIAYMEGTIDDPKITKVLAIDEYDETQLDKARRNIYDLERRGIQQKTQGVFRLYREVDFGSYADFTRNVERDKRNNLQLGTDRGAGSRTTPKVKEILFDDEGNEVSRTVRHKSRSYTAGQMAQVKANLSHNKVYSKKSAMELVSKIAPGIRNRSFEDLSTRLWEGLNAYTTFDDKITFATDMAEIFVDRMVVDTLVKHSEWDSAVERMAYLKPAIGTIQFSDTDISELKYILDKDYPRLRGRWGYKTPSDGSFKRAYGLDEFISDLSREMPGMEYLAEMHPAEALIEVDKLYTDLQEQIKEKYESAYGDMSDAELNEIKQMIATEIMGAYNTLGEKTRIAKYLEEKFTFYQSRIDYWKAENAKTHNISRWNGIISTKALQIRDLKKGAFYNATQYHEPDLFKNSIEQLANIQWRGNISLKSIRKVFANLKQWYTKDNPMLYKENADNNLYSDTIATYISKIADSKGAFDENTYAMVYDVMNHLYTMMRNYNKIFRAGRWEDAPDLVNEYLKIMEQTKRNRNALTRVQTAYNTEFLEPMAVARHADGYDPNGFFTQTMEDLRSASINASIGEMKLRREYDAFIDANKKYLINAAKETVNYRGHEIPKLQLIGLYMTMKREHARAGLALNGFEYTKKNKWWDSEDKVFVKGYVTPGDNVTPDIINQATMTEMSTIEKSFTDTDKQYIAILEKLFNEDLKALKVERDMERQGYTNATLDYYYPIIRGAMAENIDTSKISDQNRATNSSFNKNTVKGAKQRLVIISADAMVNRHITDMCKYYYMSQAIENYNVLYNCDVSGNANDPLNIAKIVQENKVWEKDVAYFKQLVKDMQGIREPQTVVEKFIESMRGNYAKFALGLNLKVLCTQFSSMIAAGDVISFGSILSKSTLTVSTADLYKYCPLAEVRSYDKTVLKAMTLTDKFGKFSEMFTAGISKVDSLVVSRLFAACQVEAQKLGHGELGTEENKIAAGKLLEKVIIETQQNSYATERSQAMRSKNELLKAITMFTADGMKIVSRMYDAFGELQAAKDSKDTARIKKARKQFAKSVAVAVNIAVYMTAIAWAFGWIYDREEEEDETGWDKMLHLTLDVTGNFISALPVVSELYDYMVNGFEVEGVAFDTFNNLLNGINNIRKDLESIVTKSGERTIEDINRDLRTLLYGVGQATGLPFRNVYNLARGIIGNTSSKAGYYLDSKFYKTNLSSDLDDALTRGDNSKANYILGLLYGERVNKDVSKAQREEIIRLAKLDYNVLPKDLPDKIKRDGKEYVLTATQKDKLSEEYAKVVAQIDKLISSNFYLSLSNKDKAYMIDYYHDKYYETAVNNVLKIKDDKVAVYNAVGFSTYAKFAYATRGIESDKDKNGNTIAGSKKAKVIEAINKISNNEDKKLLYLASLGYSLSDEQKKKLCKYLNSLSISASKKKSLAEICNFTYKKGKIYP
jgi:hypothetical protein